MCSVGFQDPESPLAIADRGWTTKRRPRPQAQASIRNATKATKATKTETSNKHGTVI